MVSTHEQALDADDGAVRQHFCGYADDAGHAAVGGNVAAFGGVAHGGAGDIARFFKKEELEKIRFFAGALKKRCVHGIWADGDDAHATAFLLGGEGAREREHEGFRGGVNGEAWLRQKSGDGSDLVDDTARCHKRQRTLGEIDESGAVEIDHAALLVWRDLRNLTDLAVAGGVHKRLHLWTLGA